MITIPSQHYIGLNPVRSTDSSFPLAFATPFGTDAAFEKRKNTVDVWCRGYGHYVDGKYVYPEFEAAVHDNVLMDGFRISESVRRTGWNGGNVVWRVVDPRGFELEISSSNFARIVDCSTIINGVIQGKCIWGRDGSANLLLPEASEPYQQAVSNTKRSAMSVDAKSLSVGDEVEFKDGGVWIYLGAYSIITRKESKINGGHRIGHATSYQYDIEIKKRHVFGAHIDKQFIDSHAYLISTSNKKDGDWRYYVVADTKKVATINKKNAELIDVNAIAADMTNQYKNYTNVIDSASYDYLAFAAIAGNIKSKDLTLSLQPAIDGDQFGQFVYQGADLYYARKRNHLDKYQLYRTTVDLDNLTYTQHSFVTHTDMALDGMAVYNFAVTHNDTQYRF